MTKQKATQVTMAIQAMIEARMIELDEDYSSAVRKAKAQREAREDLIKVLSE